MKVCIIGNGFSGATLPLAQHLYKNNIDIDCYYIVKAKSKCIESLDFDEAIKLSYNPQLLNKKNVIYNYLNQNINIYILPLLKRRLRLEKLLIGKIIFYINCFFINRFANYIIRQNYDTINLIVHTTFETILAKKLSDAGLNVIITYHEVLKGHSITPVLKKEVIDTLSLKFPVILHSEKTESDLLSLSVSQNIKTSVIRFGAFESYLSYGHGITLNIKEGYILYLGHIFPHKGLKYLYEAVIKSNIKKKIVIAGNGYDEILEKMKMDSRFIIINRFIKNNELVWLIQNCSAVVCPYISGSQSGLVQTAMVFGKPIIATKVGAFSEIIKDGINGRLVEPCSAEQLASALSKEINYRKRTDLEFIDWKFIVSQYINIFKNENNNV